MRQASLNNGSAADFFRGKRILLLGFGREGRSSYSFLRSLFPQAKIGIADSRQIPPPDADCTMHCGEDYLSAMGEYELVLKSPGIAFVDVNVPEGVEISCQTDIFLRFAPCVTIGVTGTKGKTTSSTLIYEMLRESGVSAVLAGNMGLPVLDDWQRAQDGGSVFVLELSSHQLEFTHASPHIAVWTNLYPEHLDHYAAGFEGYANAKRNITRHQSDGDYFIFPSTQPLKKFMGKAKPCPVEVPEKAPFPLSDRLLGAHNLCDVMLAARAAALAGATQTGIERAAAGFAGVPHRMEPIGSFGGVDFIDDCIATVPAATLAALAALPGCRTLILGGQDRGIDYEPFCKELCKSSLRTIILMPDTGERLAALLQKHGAPQRLFFARKMEKAVAAAISYTGRGELCLLSPAAPSYNLYRDFEEKAAHFRQCLGSVTQA
jgi:UDP-N-acetylmuramoylalanine--D-glutamate ligase